MQADVWAAREGVPRLTDDMVGYVVEGRDARIGKIDRVSCAWQLLIRVQRQVMKHRHAIPADAVDRVDAEHKSAWERSRLLLWWRRRRLNRRFQVFVEAALPVERAYYSDPLAKQNTHK